MDEVSRGDTEPEDKEGEAETEAEEEEAVRCFRLIVLPTPYIICGDEEVEEEKEEEEEEDIEGDRQEEEREVWRLLSRGVVDNRGEELHRSDKAVKCEGDWVRGV